MMEQYRWNGREFTTSKLNWRICCDEGKTTYYLSDIETSQGKIIKHWTTSIFHAVKFATRDAAESFAKDFLKIKKWRISNARN